MNTANLWMGTKIHLAVIDDDEMTCATVYGLFSTQGHTANFFNNASYFYNAGVNNFDCILLEPRLKNGMDGLKLHRQLLKHGYQTPVIIMTALGDVKTVFQAARQGISTRVVKPLDSLPLWTALQHALKAKNTSVAVPNRRCPTVTSLLEYPEGLNVYQWYCFLCAAENSLSKDLWQALKSLTFCEAKVFLLLAKEGESNKRLAERLGVDLRTVEIHRAKVFKKLNFCSILQLRDLLNQINPP